MENVIVTGGTGFIGSNLILKLIEEGFYVNAIIRENSDISFLPKEGKNISYYEYNGDINDLVVYFEQIKPKYVFHLASLFIAEHKVDNVNDLIASNVLFGTQILEAMRLSGVKNIINTGTSWQHYNDEEYNPVCLYAATKQSFEAILEYYVQAENFNAITLVLFDTYGENDKRPKLINLLNKFADEGTVLNMSEGNQMMNLVHVSDVCRAYVLSYQMIENRVGQIKNKRFFLRTDEIYSLREVISCFEKKTGKKVNVNWGGRPYRKREVMSITTQDEILPGWEALKKFYK